MDSDRRYNRGQIALVVLSAVLFLLTLVIAFGIFASAVHAQDCATEYDRGKFRHWLDVDGDGLNAREQAILRQAVVLPGTGIPIARVERGRVVAGLIRDPYTGRLLTVGKDAIDGDHVISLAEAWDRGAACWSPDLRNQFANDPDNVVATAARTNRQKGRRNLFEWIPPSIGDCRSFLDQIAILVTRYPLKVTAGERNRYGAMRLVCEDWRSGIRLDKALAALDDGWLDDVRD
jgi:hypothetical protein